MLKKNAFTLIEFLVVMFVISTLASVSLVKYRNSQKKYVLSGAVQELIAELRNVQNMAMQGTEMEGKCDINNECSGYGVYINKNNDFYLVFSNKNPNQSWQPSDIEIKRISLPTNIKFGSYPNKVSIYFESPYSTGYIDGNSNNTNTTITLEYEGTSLTKTISVTSAGLIE